MSIEQIIATVIGWVILILVASYSIPQFIKIVKTKNTSSLSIVSYTAFVVSNALMTSWGIGNALKGLALDYPVWSVCLTLIPNILSNLLNLTINTTALIIKIKHVKLAKQFGISEMQLATKLLKDKKGGAR